MNITKCEIWKDRFCNECRSQNDIEEVQIGSLISALCVDCRKSLVKILEKNTEEKCNPKLYHVKTQEDWDETIAEDYTLIVAESKEEAEEKAANGSSLVLIDVSAKEIKELDGYKIKLERIN